MERIWWEHIPNAVKFISDAVEHLLTEKSIVIRCGSALPWRQYFIDWIMQNIREQDCTRGLKSVFGVDNPGKYLLEEYCKPEKRATYRPSKSYAKFLAESDDIVLHERYIVVEPETDAEMNRWLEFISEYTSVRGSGKTKAVFMVMYCGTCAVTARKGITDLSFDEYITEYDRVAFATLASASINAKPFVKSYLAELASNVVGNDVELCAMCIRRWREFLQNPIALIEDILNTELDSNGERFSFEPRQSEIDATIWRAQIRAIYPHIEEYRERFIKRNRPEIYSALPLETSVGIICEEPEDVELGMLIFLAGCGKLILGRSEYERLEKYRDARNALSHLRTLSFAQIEALHIAEI